MSYEQLAAAVDKLSVDNVELADTARSAIEIAQHNAELSRKWADTPEDVEVIAGKFSALHWAIKAQREAVAVGASIDTRLDDFSEELLASAGAGTVGFSKGAVYPKNTVGMALNMLAIETDITYLVPTDYPDLQTALSAMSAFRTSMGKMIEVKIEAGYVIREGYKLRDMDLGHVKLTSVDPIVKVSADFKHVETYDLPAGVARGNLFSFVHANGVAPRWDIVVDHAAAISGGGYCLYWGRGYISVNKGVINVDYAGATDGEGGAGFKVGGASHFIAPYAKATGCGVGIALTQSTVGDVQYADATGCRLTGIDVSRGSLVYALSSKVDNARREGFYVRRSRVIAEAASIKNCPVGVRAQATAEVSCVNAVFDNCPNAVNRGSAAFVEISGATANGIALDLQPALLFPATVNVMDQQGCTFSNTQVAGNAAVLTAINTSKAIAAGAVSASPAAWSVLSEVTGNPRDIFGGTIYGYNIGFRLTLDDVVVINTVANTSGQDSAGNAYTVYAIPPFRCKNSYKLEVYNRDGANARGVGFNLYRVI